MFAFLWLRPTLNLSADWHYAVHPVPLHFPPEFIIHAPSCFTEKSVPGRLDQTVYIACWFGFLEQTSFGCGCRGRLSVVNPAL